MPAHSHDHSHHHSAAGSGGRRLLLALLLTTVFAAVEAVGGWLSGSLALISDAGHMLTDSAALAMGAAAAWFSGRPPSVKHPFGLRRAEVLGALLNTVFMLAIVGWIVAEAIERFRAPVPVHGGAVMLVAFVGLMVNIGVALILTRGRQTFNTRGALLHVFGDMLGSVGALISGAVIFFSGWLLIDPLLSLFISLLILVSSLRLLREVLHVLMEGVPPGIDLERVAQTMLEVDGVSEVHDLRIWGLAAGSHCLTAHVLVADLREWPAVYETLTAKLAGRFDLDDVTLQPEPASGELHVANHEATQFRAE